MVTISAICPMLIAGMIQLAGSPARSRNGTGQLKVGLVDERVHEGHDEEHQNRRHRQKSDRLERRIRGLGITAGGVAGSVNENAASANEANPATTKMLESAASSASPVLPARMNTNGQLAAIHPIVPHSRMRPKSFRASCT